ncbi:BspA family leucine-rich repeat surface protein [Aquimarina sp. 2201CG14-23]|uniref:BspA family leucine-rich repeat surface protein n=1 Tax=Aquimarina mycalae TaxID=3040073 RepID=UPI0024782A0E|nr:BspA family leucine-rich repeat surface protein [Aquimarina sp. 2201CG14-23]MDH7447529.1 BspA family leucine-rich repeat surface protein [Aquimarina sp. 2201CG14-23]
MKHLYITLLFIVSSFYGMFAQDAFITTWQTTSTNESIAIPTAGSGYNYSVDWGDGTIESGFIGDTTHEYAVAGTYTVSITGDFPRIYFNNSGDKDKIRTIEQWGTISWASMASAFYGCSGLTLNADDTPDLSAVTDVSQMFRGARSFVDAKDNIGIWNVSTVTNMSNMFRVASDFNENISSWNVGNVTNFSFMLSTTNIFNQNLNTWNIGENVTGTINMSGMFDSTLAFNQPLNDWDVSKVTNMSGMFGVTPQFNQPLNNWDTGNVSNMGGMFFGANKFDQNLGDWNLSSITNMSSMFQQSGLSTENYDAILIGWATQDIGETIPSNISISFEGSQYCFGADARNTLTDSTGLNWNIDDDGAACSATDFFTTIWQTAMDNESITIPTTGSGYDYDIDWGDGTIETGFTGNATHQYSIAGTYTVSITGDFPRIYFNNSNDKDKIISVNQWGIIEWTSMESAFYGCTNLTVDASDTPDLTNSTTLRAMFKGSTNLIDVQGTFPFWNVSTIVDFGQMFMNTDKFNTSLISWNFSVAEDFSEMFRGAKVFNQSLGIPFKAKTFEGMFRDAVAFNQPLFWYTPDVISLKDMFDGATSFDQNLGSFTINSVTDMTGMFTNAGLSTQNYDQTLAGWFLERSVNDTRPNDITFDGGNSQYCLAGDIIEKLTDDHGWQITDSGPGCDESDVFEMTWDLTSENRFTMPTSGNGYDYTLSLSNGEIFYVTSDIVQVSYSENIGMLTVRIYGDFPRFDFDAPFVDKEKLASIEQWGSLQLLEANAAFEGCTNLVLNATDTPDLSQIQFMDRMFENTSSFVDNGGEMNNWDVSTVTSMTGLFERSAFNENINDWDVSKVEDFSSMFKNNTSFNQPLNNWNTEKANDLTNMFDGATAFNQPIGMWNTALAQYFDFMFLNASTFNQNLGSWDISNTDRNSMDGMLTGSAMSQINYDATLIGWATLESGEIQIPTDVKLDADTFYCLSETARNTLTGAPYNWTINDLGNSCPEDAFITTWQTTTTNESITIPTNGSGYNYIVDWGDGTIETGFTGNATHLYATADTYTVKITGDFPRIYFNNTGDIEKIQSIEQWGTQPWKSFQNAFSGCSQLQITANDAPDLSDVTNLTNMFRSCTSLDTPDFSNWDTSSITVMKEMFYRANNFDGNITNWDVGKVTSFELMFYEAFKFNQNISNWNIGESVSTKVINMNSMFSTASSFNQPIGSWDLGKVLNIRSMFFRAGAFNQPLNSWNISGMGTLKRLFFSASRFNQPLDSWDVSTISNMDEMFWGASSFNQNLGDWNVSEVTIMNRLFLSTAMSTANYDATLIGWATLESGETQIPANLTLDSSSFYCLAETARNTLTSAPYNWTINDLGNSCPEDFFITTWQTTTTNESITIPTNSTGYNYIVDWGDGTIETGFTGNATHQYATGGTYTVKITGDFPRIRFNTSVVGNQSKIQTIEQWGTQQWDTFSSGFNGCVNLKLNADDVPDLSQVTQLSSMFEGCTNFEDLKNTIGSWDVSTIERIDSMFTACSIFDEDISGWVFTNLIRTDSAFEEAFLFNQNISNWNMATVTDMAYMFYDAEAFNQPIGNWTLGTVEYMTGMFSGALAFNQDLTNWDFSQVQEIEELFSRASSFDQDLSSWDISSVTSMTGIFTDAGLSQANYDAILTGWASLETGETQIPVNLTLDASSFYCLAETARNTLTSAPFNWTINDLGNACPEDPFITIWQTTAENQSIRIPKHPSSSGYNYIVDWGDGTKSLNQTGTVTHEYASAGTYTVKIYGNFPHPYFDNLSTDVKLRLLTIEQWGTQQWTSMVSGFEDCPNLKLNADDNPDFSQLTNVEDMFRKCTNFEDLKDKIGSWDMSTVENISFMFDACTIFNEDITQWTFTNLKDAGYVFKNTMAFNQNISNWNVSTVETFESMFEGTAAFNQPIGTWTIGTVDYMISMFKNATAFNQDLSGWNMSNVEDLEDMFEGASNFDQNLGGWDISNVIYMDEMFIGTGISQANYDATLIGWATLETGETQIPADLDLRADATYCLAETARNTLTSAPYNWMITDGGLDCDTTAPIITLLGDNPQEIELGAGYVELGAVTDDGSQLIIDDSEFVDAIGTYTIYYNATDTSGNMATEVTRTVNVVPVLSIEDLELDQVVITPNPANSYFQISGLSDAADINIYTVNGVMLKQISVTKIHRINIQELPVGVYFVNVTSGTADKTFKLIKD